MANAYERSPHRTGDDFTVPGVIGPSNAMREVARVTHQVAPSRACVLIVGETGTGKELIARAVHDLSPRFSGPYIRVNCGALTESLLESELFGHVKGSFTGAVDNRTGRFEAAHTGSIFLDEINSTTPKLQVKLLRVLQEGEFERVGDIRTVKVDTRIVAATNRDLLDEIDAGRFREDLYYRLNVITIELPPLRARSGDVMELAAFFLRRYAEENRKTVTGFSDDARRALESYSYPGNVRELENVIERAVILCDSGRIEPRHLPASVAQGAAQDLDGMPRVPGASIAELERYAILKTLEACHGSTSRAASILGISARKIQYKLHDYDATVAGAPPASPRSE